MMMAATDTGSFSVERHQSPSKQPHGAGRLLNSAESTIQGSSQPRPASEEKRAEYCQQAILAELQRCGQLYTRILSNIDSGKSVGYNAALIQWDEDMRKSLETACDLFRSWASSIAAFGSSSNTLVDSGAVSGASVAPNELQEAIRALSRLQEVVRGDRVWIAQQIVTMSEPLQPEISSPSPNELLGGNLLAASLSFLSTVDLGASQPPLSSGGSDLGSVSLADACKHLRAKTQSALSEAHRNSCLLRRFMDVEAYTAMAQGYTRPREDLQDPDSPLTPIEMRRRSNSSASHRRRGSMPHTPLHIGKKSPYESHPHETETIDEETRALKQDVRASKLAFQQIKASHLQLVQRFDELHRTLASPAPPVTPPAGNSQPHSPVTPEFTPEPRARSRFMALRSPKGPREPKEPAGTQGMAHATDSASFGHVPTPDAPANRAEVLHGSRYLDVSRWRTLQSGGNVAVVGGSPQALSPRAEPRDHEDDEDDIIVYEEADTGDGPQQTAPSVVVQRSPWRPQRANSAQTPAVQTDSYHEPWSPHLAEEADREYDGKMLRIKVDRHDTPTRTPRLDSPMRRQQLRQATQSEPRRLQKRPRDLVPITPDEPLPKITPHRQPRMHSLDPPVVRGGMNTTPSLVERVRAATRRSRGLLQERLNTAR